MDRKSLTFFVGLAVITISSLIPITAQQNVVPPNAELLRQQDEASRERQREADNIAAIASLLSAIDRREALAEQRRSEEEFTNYAQEFWYGLWSPTTAAFITALITFCLARVAAKTLHAIKREVAAAGVSANAAKVSAALAADTLATNKQIERAYVTLSNETALYRDAADGMMKVKITVRNSGRTPAVISYAVLRPMANVEGIGPWPKAQVGEMRIPGGFLVANEHYAFLCSFKPETWARFTGNKTWLVGWVRYADAFGNNYRSGYARLIDWDATPGVNNLLWDHDGARHNYDSVEDDEGNPKNPQEARYEP